MRLDDAVALAPRKSRPRSDPRALREAFERRLGALAPPATENTLTQAVRYALLTPGKRLRPLLAILATRELGADEFDALDAGCALEMVHAASLVLDDLPAMDDAVSRRGQPATHVAFGEDAAVLAGITLLSRAYGLLATAAGLKPATRCSLVQILAQAVGADGLAGGQLRDLRPGDWADADRVADANHLKTGMLFVAAVEMAAVIAGADQNSTDRMRRFATHLGQAFQILDDLADGDLCGGTASCQCEDSGKATLLSLLGHNQAHHRLERHVSAALELLDPDGPLAALVEETFALPLKRLTPTAAPSC
ncbi:MAG: geranylgeranyl pyrophosphate synthase [Enterovirga sp.]|nr:geranylgeranyl pyrophosphate synthase [Enterovirga sp.]